MKMNAAKSVHENNSRLAFMYATTAWTKYSIRKISSSRVEKRKQKKMAEKRERARKKSSSQCKAIIQHNTLHRILPHRTASDFLFYFFYQVCHQWPITLYFICWKTVSVYIRILFLPSCNNIRFQNKPKKNIFFSLNASIRIDRHKIKFHNMSHN